MGPCFEELAEAEEFDVYEKFADEVLSPKSSQYLVSILARPEVTLFFYLKLTKMFCNSQIIEYFHVKALENLLFVIT